MSSKQIFNFIEDMLANSREDSQADLQAEITEFEDFITEHYPVLQREHGIHSRIKLVMFVHRAELLKKPANPECTRAYLKRVNLSLVNCKKILRRTEDINKWGYFCKSKSGFNYFGFIRSGLGAGDRKIKRAFQIGKDLCPQIFNRHHYTEA